MQEEKIFFVKNGDFFEVNQYLKMGYKVKSITATAECVSPWAYSNNGIGRQQDKYTGNVYAYVVLESVGGYF